MDAYRIIQRIDRDVGIVEPERYVDALYFLNLILGGKLPGKKRLSMIEGAQRFFRLLFCDLKRQNVGRLLCLELGGDDVRIAAIGTQRHRRILAGIEVRSAGGAGICTHMCRLLVGVEIRF